MLNERKTENIVRKHFEQNKIFKNNKLISIDEQQFKNPKINKLLLTASKSGSGLGKPEFIISFPSPYSDFLIVIECKADTKKHESRNKDLYKDYAVDGVLLYSSYLSKEFDVLSIAVSGQSNKDLKVSHFLQLTGSNESKKIAGNELLKIDNYLDLYLLDPIKEKINYESILDYSSELNNKLRDLDLSESHRPLLVSGILIALDDFPFRNSYMKEERPSDLAKYLVDTIEKILDKQNIQGFKQDNIRQSYGFIKTHSKMANPEKEKNDKYNTLLRDLIREIENKVFEFTKTYKYYDVIGKFYSEFLRYANGDKTLGIVLTPQHITDLFVELADINENSILLDNCCGTGGFLISAMKKMIELCNGNKDKEKNVYENKLIGVESQSNMFSLACSNMMIRGDGKANIYYGNCFDLIDEIKKHKPNVGFLNPPYSKKGENLSEWHFILNNLYSLVPNSLCLAIIPISCILDDPLKEKVLENHTLEAVLSMPVDLFHGSKTGTVTCIVILRSHIAHSINKKTWFGYFRNDGFIKLKKKGRIDKNNTWKSIKKTWVSAFKNKEIIKGLSLMRHVTANDEWCYEAYLQVNYFDIIEDDIIKEIKKYFAFKMINEEIE